MTSPRPDLLFLAFWISLLLSFEKDIPCLFRGFFPSYSRSWGTRQRRSILALFVANLRLQKGISLQVTDACPEVTEGRKHRVTTPEKPRKIPRTPPEPRRTLGETPQNPWRAPRRALWETPAETSQSLRGLFPRRASRRVVPEACCPFKTLEMKDGWSGTGMTGRPGHRTMDMNGRSTVSYLVRTPRVPF